MNRKNLFKRVSAWVLTLVMAISMFSIMALADSTWPAGWGDTITTGKLEVTKTDESGAPLEGAEYVLYKVADIVVTGGTLKYNSLTSVQVNTSTKASDFTDAILGTLTPITGTTTGEDELEGLTGADGKVTFSDLPFGVYLVKERVTPDGVVTAHNFLVSIPMSVTKDGQQTWINEVEATPKNSVFSGTISKDVAAASGHTIVTDPGANQGDPTDDKLTVSIGTKLDYTIEVTMPTDFYGPDGKTYTRFEIVDDPKESLTVDTGSIKVYHGTVAPENLLNPATDYVLDTTSVSGQFTIKLVDAVAKAPYYAGLEAEDKVIVVYSATVNENAVPGVAITNDAKIIYNYEGSDGPGTEDPDPDDPEPELYTYSHAILKVGDEGAYLNDAEFIVQNASNQYLTYNDTTKAWGTTTTKNEAYVFTSGSVVPFGTEHDGYIELIGLAYGNYTLTEIKAPSGYSLLDKTVTVLVNAASTTTQQNSGYSTTNDADYTTKIVNVAGFTLPGTGGSGIYLYMISGIVLIGAAILLYGKSRKKSSKA